MADTNWQPTTFLRYAFEFADSVTANEKSGLWQKLDHLRERLPADLSSPTK